MMMLTVAAMGGGKSLYAAWNTLLSWLGGAFVLDPKGGHAQRTIDVRGERNPAHVIDPWGDVKHLYDGELGATFNPLEEIDIHSPNAKDDIFQIVESCIMQEADENANSKHFRENAQKIMTGVIAHVLSEYSEEHHNLPTIYDIILTGSPEGTISMPEAFNVLVVPLEHMKNHSRFLRTVVSLGLMACREHADHDYKTLYLLDEFPQFGTFKPIKEGLVTLRSRDVKIWIEGKEGETKAIDKNRPLRSPSEVMEELKKGSGLQYVLPSDGLPLRFQPSSDALRPCAGRHNVPSGYKRGCLNQLISMRLNILVSGGTSTGKTTFARY